VPRQSLFVRAIVESAAQPAASTPISPDVATCDDCLRELFNPDDRRHRYPFINCTNCGPRVTIIRDVPYDRPQTTMAGFALRDDCAREYHDPANRRVHAQPVACPRVWLEGVAAQPTTPDDAIRAAQDLLRAGAIVAIKGIGGFHLACDARNDAAVRRLRKHKTRGDKPFALMARDLDAARTLAAVDDAEAAVLRSLARPIVLLNARANDLSPAIAPGNAMLGIMLPYTPLHHLLLDGYDAPLVLTSGNRSDEPICKDNDDARIRLRDLADAFLMHDRDIHVWCDDSVVRVLDGVEFPVRRSRGYAPYPVRLTRAAPPILAVGGELKSTFCVTRDNYAYLSQHIGDMENVETLDAFELEALCGDDLPARYRFAITDGAPTIFDAAPLLRDLARDVLAGVAASVLSTMVHGAVADLAVDLARRAREQTGMQRVGLSGGVFHNARLARRCKHLLSAAGFDILTHRRVPPNDGGLALGQAAVCASAASMG
jgi:hydrogenase maturation protein HypF